MKFTVRAISFVLSIILSGCAVTRNHWGFVSPIFMIESARYQISSTRVVVGLNPDSRMGPPVNPTPASGQQLGLAGVIIESALVYHENNTIQDKQRNLNNINKAALEFNFGSKFRQAIEESTKTLKWLHVSYVTKQQDYKANDIYNILHTLNEDALLLIDCKYQMASDYSKLLVFSYVALHAKNKDLTQIAIRSRPNEDPPVLYRHLFKYEFPYDALYTTSNAAIAGWSQNDGAMLKKGFSLAVKEISHQIISDMSAITVGINQ